VANAHRIQLHPSTPWSLRLFDRLPLAPIWLGTGIGLSVFGVYLVYTGMFCESIGRLGATKSTMGGLEWGAELIQDLFIGFTLTVSAVSIRGARRDLRDLLPHLEGSELETSARAAERLDREIFSYQRLPLLVTGLFVGVGSGLIIVGDPSLWADGEMPGWSHPALLWILGRNFLNWWVASRAMLLELMLGRAFSRLGDRLAEFDLLERAPLAPFGRRALRNVLLWMLLAAFLSLSYLGEGWASDLMPLALITLGSFALAAFVLPLAGAHRSVRELKRAELERIRAAIREAREQTFARGAEESPAAGRLADLLGYEARIAGVAEWPIDASILLRLGIYLAIGLGSWVGAAMVERFLETALG
jgi:hypothetical protein